jgi:hypothetical protein
MAYIIRSDLAYKLCRAIGAKRSASREPSSDECYDAAAGATFCTAHQLSASFRLRGAHPRSLPTERGQCGRVIDNLA